MELVWLGVELLGLRVELLWSGVELLGLGVWFLGLGVGLLWLGVWFLGLGAETCSTWLLAVIHTLSSFLSSARAT